MHKNFVGDFDCPVCPHPGWGTNSVYTCIKFARALNSVKSSFCLLLLDHSLEYFTHILYTQLALIKAIASLQQSTRKAKCTLCGRFFSLCFIYMCM